MCLNIGAAIKTRREAYVRSGKRMTQEKFAERIGRSADYVRRLETGKHSKPSEGLVLRMARALELDGNGTNDLLLDCGHEKLPELMPI
ncbi:MAG: helix-turn-helix domain-containing protein [Chloroflexota bacterium]|nr:helix-turn-helix domain-containing protein [Chloroflexota bacterium]